MIAFGTGAPSAPRRWGRLRLAFRLAAGAAPLVCASGATMLGCLDRPIAEADPRTTQTVVDVVGQSAVDKIDLLLVIDNSRSMADKQEILAKAVPELVKRLVTPLCIDPATGLAGESVTYSDRDGSCPEGLVPEFRPIDDIHVGIISSSIGSVGAPTCAASDTNDEGRLLTRIDPDDPSKRAATYEDQGYLAWDPKGKHPCPGEPVGGDRCPGLDDPEVLIGDLTEMVRGVGETGCGYEAPLEAAYRFLGDPAPYAQLQVDDAGAVSKVGADEDLLAQRRSFLRPDSLLAVIMLTDENDCSFRVDGASLIAADAGQKMPRAREECAQDPSHACCASCWLPAPEDCPGDGGCADPEDQGNAGNYYDPPPKEGEEGNDSHNNIRCWDQKRRFGTDFLYPTERYVNAFSSPLVAGSAPDLALSEGEDGVENPIFFSSDGEERPTDRVFVAGIVGVPWQLIARKDASEQPSLTEGLDASGAEVGGFQSYKELDEGGTWKRLLPESAIDQPDSALMIESPDMRLLEGKDEEVNGGDWTTRYTDLQYACIFDLEETSWKECTQDTGGNCDCDDPADKPLCAKGVGTNPTNDPEDPPNQPNTLQVRAKAYPGTRVLQVLQGLEGQGIPASICPAQTSDVTARSYGYTPAVFSIIDRLKGALQSSCQPRELPIDENYDVPCIVIEASDSDGDEDASTTSSCEALCAESGRAPIGDETKAAAKVVRTTLDGEDTDTARSYDCLCEIEQLTGKPSDADWESSPRYRCQYEQFPPTDSVNGWCYVDASATPPVGNPDLRDIAQCAPTERRLVRPVNNGVVKSGGRLYITCSGDAATPVEE
jgi:hypothetical protein